MELIGLKTPDTTQIVNMTLGLMKQWNIPPENIFFDRGGGGKQHSDRMRELGFQTKTVAFGEAATPPKRRGHSTVDMRTKDTKKSYIYKNRRAELYGELRNLLNPLGPYSFAIPSKLLYRSRSNGGPSLYDQLRLMPLLYDGEGRMYLPPKRKKNAKDPAETLIEILGCSPDESDALALAAYGLLHKPVRRLVGMS